MTNGPHQGQPVRSAGLPVAEATAAMVMVHGRGATSESILTLVPSIDVGEFAFLAPQAAGNTWYPNSFLSPIESNEPGITSGIAAIDAVIDSVRIAGIPAKRTVLLGFSQGACLAIEYAARNAMRYGGIACLSGGLIGPDETARDYPGSFAGTRAFLGCSDIDGHIPARRVIESAGVLGRMGCRVTAKLYPGMGHTINDHEIASVRTLMERVLKTARK